MPAFQRIPITYSDDSAAYFRSLQHLEGVVWLDSGARRFYNSRYDILTALPAEHISCQGDECEIRLADGDCQVHAGNALTYLEKRLAEMRSELSSKLPQDLPFTGGAIGYLSYEAFHPRFSLQRPASTLPHSCFGIYEWALIQDHQRREAYVCFHSTCSTEFIEQILQTLKRQTGTLPGFRCAGFVADTDRDTYLGAVRRIQDYIRAGDCYQVNHTQRFTGTFDGSTASAYLHLRNALPSPFSAYYKTPAGTILSLSPERFLERHGNRIRTQPIKGTAPRGDTPEKDGLLAQELVRSEKNRAENLMIVDLLRNDFSKVSKPFSVDVTELFGLQSYANVHHLVSTITGEVSDTITSTELLSACFPGGSITGAPKKRAMEIIDELEDHSRDVYCGSMLYLSSNGRLDSNIAIRTLVQTGDKIHCWGGGGIVADSDPAQEYQESLHKIGLLLQTLENQ